MPKFPPLLLLFKIFECKSLARLAQSVERKALNLVVVGSSPTVGVVISAALYSDECEKNLRLAAESKSSSGVSAFELG